MMQATKETAVLAYLAALLAGIFTWLISRRRDSTFQRPQWRWWHLVSGLALAALVASILLSSFFTNMRGPLDGILTYFPWLHRAGGDSPHVNPWSFYLHRLIWWHATGGRIWSEGLVIALAALGAISAFREPGDRDSRGQTVFVRWLVGYTLALIAIYSLIPYKTPWCLIQFLVGLILLAGTGVSVLLQTVRKTSSRVIIAALLVLGAGHLAWQSYETSFVIPADVGNPYVFAQTSPDVLRLADTCEQLAAASPQGFATPVKVIWNDAYYWPLPWYLRRFERVEWWRSLPPDPAPPVILLCPSMTNSSPLNWATII